MSCAAVLVVAKAPVAGSAKTRLAADVGDTAAADLAAAALLDTLAVCADVFGARVLALTGDLACAARRDELERAIADWHVIEQRGVNFGERLAHAHEDAADHARQPVLQLGMDTPQVTSGQLEELDSMLGARYDAVLGPADDGGWWALGVTGPALVDGLGSVPMSSSRTGEETLRLLRDNGAGVWIGETLSDVDVVADAVAVSETFPGLRFSSAWAAASGARGAS